MLVVEGEGGGLSGVGHGGKVVNPFLTSYREEIEAVYGKGN